MLQSSKLVAFIATANPLQARSFYQDKLGLTLLEDTPFALVFNAHGTTLRVQKVGNISSGGYTTLGWDVADIRDITKRLLGSGVAMQRYNGLDQDEAGIWRSPGGALVAWFKDPDGNTLSLTQLP
jgi:catechol 2,3-dioxygenase-like lactoylglutathione lyase family enzyme